MVSSTRLDEGGGGEDGWHGKGTSSGGIQGGGPDTFAHWSVPAVPSEQVASQICWTLRDQAGLVGDERGVGAAYN